ncbi:MAG: DUF4159 domain-containing protein [Flavobacteriaceae bacterium]
MNKYITFLIFILTISLQSQEVAVLKYDGGGDWYANPTAVPNLIAFCNENIDTKITETPKVVSPDSVELFVYPIVFMTGHGNVFFDENTIENLRNYLTSGGFLHISDNYGLDKYIRKEMKKIFPKLDFEEIPNDHAIYHQNYDFESLPKIHEHDNQSPQGFGLFYEGRLVCFYDFQCDLSDGWEDAAVHHDPEEVREKALKMGANIVKYAFSN